MDYLAEPGDLATATGLSADSAKLLLALKRASGRFRQEVGHPVSLVEADTIRLDGTGTRVLLLPAAPVRDVTVTIDGREVSGYSVGERDGRLVTAGYWPAGVGNIQVTYTHGYEEIPEGIQDAVLEHATTLALTYAHVQQETAGGLQAGYGAAAMVGVTQKWADAVNTYRLRDRT